MPAIEYQVAAKGAVQRGLAAPGGDNDVVNHLLNRLQEGQVGVADFVNTLDSDIGFNALDEDVVEERRQAAAREAHRNVAKHEEDEALVDHLVGAKYLMQ